MIDRVGGGREKNGWGGGNGIECQPGTLFVSLLTQRSRFTKRAEMGSIHSAKVNIGDIKQGQGHDFYDFTRNLHGKSS